MLSKVEASKLKTTTKSLKLFKELEELIKNKPYYLSLLFLFYFMDNPLSIAS